MTNSGICHGHWGSIHELNYRWMYGEILVLSGIVILDVPTAKHGILAPEVYEVRRKICPLTMEEARELPYSLSGRILRNGAKYHGRSATDPISAKVFNTAPFTTFMIFETFRKEHLQGDNGERLTCQGDSWDNRQAIARTTIKDVLGKP